MFSLQAPDSPEQKRCPPGERRFPIAMCAASPCKRLTNSLSPVGNVLRATATTAGTLWQSRAGSSTLLEAKRPRSQRSRVRMCSSLPPALPGRRGPWVGAEAMTTAASAGVGRYIRRSGAATRSAATPSAARAEQRIGQQRNDGGVGPVSAQHARGHRIGDADRDQHGRQHDPGNDVVAQPRELVLAHRAKPAQPAGQT
jgi:hypothetical protein